MRVASFLILFALAAPAQAQISLPIDFEAAVDYELTDFGGAEQSAVVADPEDASNMVTRTVRPASAECFAGTTVADATGFTERVPFTADAQTMSVRVWSPEAGVLVLFKVEEVGNPALNVETYTYTTVAGGWETMVFDFADPKPNTNPVQPGANYNKASIFFDFQCDNVPPTTAPPADRTYYWDDVEFGGEGGGGGEDGIALPITFEDDALDYELQDFGGAMSMLVADPTDGANTVVQSVRTAGAECFAGTTVADVTGFDERVPFTPDATTMSVRVWSPEAGIRVLFKVEEVGNPGLNVETTATTTMAGMWETLVFDFANPMPNANPIQFGANYNKASIFFDFSCDNPPPTAPPERTYYWDDVAFDGDGGGGGGGGDIALPITFEDGMLDYELQDFGGAMSVLVADPADASNTVVQTNRSGMAECFAGTTVGDVTGFTQAIPFTPEMTTMSVRVWSPEAGVLVLFKVEEVGNPALNVETFSFTTVAGGWETLVFDFGTPMPNENPIQFGANYNKASIFFDFQCDNVPPSPLPAADRTYYWDDVAFGGETATPAVVSLPVTFEQDIDYELQDFGGNASSLVADPTDGANTVVQSIRTADAACFAGTTVADVNGFTQAIPFMPGMTSMNLRVWSPVAGIPVRLKVEDVTDAGVSVEAEVATTAVGMWETLVYDFSNQVPGTAAISFDASYTKASVFFDFACGVEPPPNAPERTYYWDDLAFGLPPAPVVSLPITFEEGIDYDLVDFGGAASQLVADPEDAQNTVVETVRTAGALAFAGTTVADELGFTEPIAFTESVTTMNLRVWTPAPGTSVRVKVENADDPSVSVETQVQSNVGMAWETLTLDFANEFPTTPPLDLTAEYTKVSVFFDFGTEGATDATTYYWDDVELGPAPVDAEGGGGADAEVRLAQNAPNPFRAQTEIRFSLPAAGDVQLHVYNALGQQVATLVEGPMAAGDHAVTLDGSDLASGAYVYRLVSGSEVTTRSMVVVR